MASVELECSLGLAQHIVIIAHSYGGVVTMSLASSRDMRRLAGVFLTDSVHVLCTTLSQGMKTWTRGWSE